MATNSSVLAWRIPGTEEPGGLLSMGSQSDMTEQLSSSSSRDYNSGTLEHPLVSHKKALYDCLSPSLCHSSLLTWHPHPRYAQHAYMNFLPSVSVR